MKINDKKPHIQSHPKRIEPKLVLYQENARTKQKGEKRKCEFEQKPTILR
jgi:hypothetical protein